MIIPLAEKDLEEIGCIHLAAFPDAVMSRLGAGTVRRYYDWQLHGPHDHTSIGISEDGRLQGFAIGGISRGATGGFVRRHRLYLAGAVLMHPGWIFDRRWRDRVGTGLRSLLIRNRRKPGTASVESRERPGRSFGVLVLAVKPQAQGRGYGRALLLELRRVAEETGFSRMHLTVSPGNHRAIKVYEGLGWTRFSAGASWTGRMELDLNRAAAGTGPSHP